MQSVKTALDVLRAFIDLGPAARLTEVAARAGMHRAKAHRYLATFCKAGFIDRELGSKRYRLGHMSLRLGLAAMNGVDGVRLAQPMMPQLRDAVGHSVVLAVWGPSGPMVVLFEYVHGSIAVTARVGSVLPLLTSSTGRTFAAWLPRAVTAGLLEAELKRGMAGRSAGTPRTMEEAERLFKEVRRRRLSRVTGQLSPGVHAMSAPVFDHSGGIVAVLSALGAAPLMNTNWDGPLARKLTAAAAALSEALGYRVAENVPVPRSGRGRARDAASP